MSDYQNCFALHVDYSKYCSTDDEGAWSGTQGHMTLLNLEKFVIPVDCGKYWYLQLYVLHCLLPTECNSSVIG